MGETQKDKNPFDHRTLEKVPSGLQPDRSFREVIFFGTVLEGQGKRSQMP